MTSRSFAHIFISLNTCLLSSTRFSSLILCFICPSHFSKKFWFHLMEDGLQKQKLELGMLIVYICYLAAVQPKSWEQQYLRSSEHPPWRMGTRNKFISPSVYQKPWVYTCSCDSNPVPMTQLFLSTFVTPFSNSVIRLVPIILNAFVFFVLIKSLLLCDQPPISAVSSQ